ncbi:outer membrane protein assembly factor BamE [Idiomarina sp. OT37-5b]|jgi:outer membrane protein assembly factor BamE|uniref:Outer membrane protein assembly factor BamE n=1 Tax=Idiomarina aquatica TaxID=1327752 RepID=A0AA94EG52_9GAMM|nr:MULTISPECIES: outer membrane protein assembly factor BamE [Idiomarina]AVJ55520.1 outer membrane protein assembly factor BamE [Idiomarina sp. OT37-5b]RUO44861.1 outer membrane protein assembly factor BamE [Idiomarina aquatica]
MKSTLSKLSVATALVIGLSSCSTLNEMVYRIDIPQGNYLEQRDVDKLRVGMTQEQVAYVLGRPVAQNAFDSDRWVYLYEMNPNSGKIFRKELILDFNAGLLVQMSGDFEEPEEFDTPLDE